MFISSCSLHRRVASIEILLLPGTRTPKNAIAIYSTFGQQIEYIALG